MQRVPGWEALSSEQRLATQELRLRVAHHGWGGGQLQVFSSQSCKLTFVLVTCGGPRPVLRDMRRLLLQRDRQHHHHPSGGRNHGGDGVQEAGAPEVQSPRCGQHGFLRDR